MNVPIIEDFTTPNLSDDFSFYLGIRNILNVIIVLPKKRKKYLNINEADYLRSNSRYEKVIYYRLEIIKKN